MPKPVMFYRSNSHWRIFTLFMVACIWEMQHVHPVLHHSHLCEPIDMPCRREYGDECRMKYYKLNSTDCRDLAFNNNPTTGDNYLGNVQIKSYHYNLKTYKQTGFNLTFTDINWNHLKFRFKQEGNEMKNTCREFYMLENSTVKNLFYDCLWSNENYEGKTFSFEYEATNNKLTSYKKFSFQVPFAKNIDEHTKLSSWETFIFVETVQKNSFGLTTFILHWQPLPERFSVNSYSVKAFSNKSGEEEVTVLANITCNNEHDCKYYYNSWFGSIQFGIQPNCENGSECFLSKTAVFILGGESAKPLLIGIVSVTMIVPAMLYVIYLLRNYLSRKSKKRICQVPKVLIIFTPSLSSHVNVVFGLVEYLRMYCNVEPLLDELHIFNSKSRDPFKWCNEALKTADFVMVVASPYYKQLRLANTIYQKTDILLLRLLRQRLASKEEKIRFFLLMLPYCSESDIPSEAINLRRFFFPEDLNKMLRFIHKDRSLLNCISPEIGGGKETYKILGKKLSEIIGETQASLKKNKAEYDRMAEEVKNEKNDFEEKKEEEDDMKVKVQGKQNKIRKKKMLEFAEDIFSEFPGRIDELNLSGEEEMSLMRSEKNTGKSDIINLDVLEL